MFDKLPIKNIVIVIITLALLIFSVFTLHQAKSYKAQNDNLKLELNKFGELVIINDSLQAYTGKISLKFDSVIKVNTDLNNSIKNNNESPQVITVFKTNTVIKEVPVYTFIDPASADSSSRIADIKDKWFEFNASYRIREPFDFKINSLLIPDNFDILQVKTETGRIKVYVKNHNPYVKVSSLETYIEPSMIVENNIIEKDYWEWSLNSAYNFYSKDVNISGGVYAPFGVGLYTNYNIIKNNNVSNPIENFGFGIGILKKF